MLTFSVGGITVQRVPEGTTISIEVQVGADAVDLHVIDEGPGMDLDAMGHAFERFWRPAGDRARSQGGFGLGLAIVDQLARRSGGRTHLQAGRDGRGLDVGVSLPRADPSRRG